MMRNTMVFLALLLAVLACGLALTVWMELRERRPAPGARPAGDNDDAPWLVGSYEERFSEIERQFGGMSIAMAEIGYRFTELHFAGLDRNWDYAAYQLEHLQEALEHGLVRRPARAANARPFLAEDLPVVERAIAAGDPAEFGRAMERLRTACMKCHVNEDVPWITVELPEARLAPVRTIR